MNIKIEYETKLEDFQKVILFTTALSIQRNFESFGDYSKCQDRMRIANALHIDASVYTRLSTWRNQYCFDKMLLESTNLFTFHRHLTKKYSSGKTFNLKSWFEIKPEILKEMFSDEKKYLRIESDYYTSRQHKLVDKYIFKYESKGNNDMTKT